MTPQTLAEFKQITDAEDYFEFFDLPYDPQVVNVNRLHILRKFSQLLGAIDVDDSLSENQRLGAYRQALQTAYELFLSSTSLQEKLFKVFQERPSNVVMLSDIEAE